MDCEKAFCICYHNLIWTHQEDLLHLAFLYFLKLELPLFFFCFQTPVF